MPQAKPSDAQVTGTQPSASSPASPLELLDEALLVDVVDAEVEELTLLLVEVAVASALVGPEEVVVVREPPEPEPEDAPTTTVLPQAASTVAPRTTAMRAGGFMATRSIRSNPHPCRARSVISRWRDGNRSSR